ncbi:hypothetical protein RmaAA213_18420 [Rhodothermus marinus]|nr:hypothetical protein RmaAA213_18420 [Rhodothermus marinus]
MDDPVYAGYRHYVEKLKGLFNSYKKKDFFRGRRPADASLLVPEPPSRQQQRTAEQQ